MNTFNIHVPACKTSSDTTMLYFVDVIERVMNNEDPVYRPHVPDVEDHHKKMMMVMMKECWKEDPKQRPSMVKVNRMLRAISGGKSVVRNTVMSL